MGLDLEEYMRKHNVREALGRGEKYLVLRVTDGEVRAINNYTNVRMAESPYDVTTAIESVRAYCDHSYIPKDRGSRIVLVPVEPVDSEKQQALDRIAAAERELKAAKDKLADLD